MADLTVVMTAGKVHRQHCPVQVALPEMPAATDLSGVLVDGAGAETPCQLERGGDQCRLWWLVADLPAGQAP